LDTLSENDIVLKTYRIDRMIGQGAFGRVYKATHINLNGVRAIKVLYRNDTGIGSTEYSEYRDRFRQESQLMERLKSPNIIQVFDFQEENDTLFLVMEYAAGGSLKEKMDQYKADGKTFSFDETVKIGLDIASGLSHLHKMDVVHRDLKPSNILFDAAGNARIADLGLAQVPGGASMRSVLSVAKSHPGTPAYMSPEQAQTGTYLRPSSDIYSLGLILFEMVTGRLYKNVKPGSRLSTFIPDAPVWLDDLVGQMLAENPKDRPWDGNEAVEKLKRSPSSNLMEPAPKPVPFKVNSQKDGSPPSGIVSETNATINKLDKPAEESAANKSNPKKIVFSTIHTKKIFWGGIFIFFALVIFLIIKPNMSLASFSPIFKAFPKPPDVIKDQTIINDALDKEMYLVDSGINLIADQGPYISRFINYCSENKTVLDTNLKSSNFEITVDGIAIPFDSIGREADYFDGTNLCVDYILPLNNWETGLHQIKWKFTLMKDMSTGGYTFPAGYNRTQSSYVLVLPEIEPEKEYFDWSEIIKYDFSNNQDYFWSGEFEDEVKKGSVKTLDGNLVIDIENQKISSGSDIAPLFASFAKNSYFSIETSTNDNNISKFYCYGVYLGKIEKLTDIDHMLRYRYHICKGNGKYVVALAKLTGSQSYVPIMSKEIQNISNSKNNKLAILKKNNQFGFYLNDDLVTNLDLPEFDAIRVGGTYEFDNLSVKIPANDIGAPFTLD
jgi:serine/threonine protein kinase